MVAFFPRSPVGAGRMEVLMHKCEASRMKRDEAHENVHAVEKQMPAETCLPQRLTTKAVDLLLGVSNYLV